MKLSVLKENLLDGLSKVSRLTSKSISLPILSNVLISTEKNFLKLSATDLEIGIKYWALANVEKEGSLTLPAKFLTDLVNLIPGEKISLEVKGNVLLLEGTGYKNEIKGLAAEEFPIIPEIKGEDSLEVKGSLLSDGLSQVVGIASPSQARPEISGVYLSFKGEELEIVATDSFRLAERKIEIKKKGNFPDELSLIIPQKTARELINVFGEKEEKVKIFVTPNQVMFEAKMKETDHPQVQIVSRMIDGEYPNYKEIIPQDFKTKVIVQRQSFLSRVKAANLFSGKINKVKIKTDPDKEVLDVFAQSSDLGQSETQVDCKKEGEDTEVSFNSRFFIDGLLSIKDKDVVFELNGEGGPGVLKPTKNKGFIYVVMPLLKDSE